MSRRVSAKALAAVVALCLCTSCSLRNSDEVIRANYASKTVGLTVSGVIGRKTGTALAVGATLGIVAGLAHSLSAQAKIVTIVAALIIDFVAVTLLSEEEIYEIGTITARERSCPLLVQREDLGRIADVGVASAVEMNAEIQTALNRRQLDEIPGVPEFLRQRAPTYRESAIALSGQIVQAYAGHHVLVSAIAGGFFNSVALYAVGKKAEAYYAAKAERICQVH